MRSRSADAVRAELERLAGRFPDDLAYDVVYDTTVFVKTSIEEVLHTLVEAFVLVAIVVFLFLGKLRTTLIPIIAVPVSLIGTFAVMLAIGFSANTVSLLALVLAIGIVVDDAIVVVENVERVMEEEPHLSAKEATRKAMGEIVAPIIAITLVLLSVFVPVAFIPGISGQLFQQFAVAVSVSMVISAINALSLSPALCSVLLKPGAHATRGPMRYVMGAIDWTRDGYAAIVKRLVRVSVLSLVALAVVVVATGALFRITPTGFLPAEDQGAFFAQIVAAGGRVGQPHRRRSCSQVEQIMSATPGIIGVSSITGLNFLNNLAQSNSAFLVMTLAPFEERLAPELGVEAILRRVQPQLAAIAGATAFAFNLPPIIGLGSTGGFEYQLQDLGGREIAELAQVMRGLIVEANQQPELFNVFSTFAADTPQLYLDLDRNKAQTLGVQISDVFTALQGTLGGLYINDFNLFGRTWQVNIQADQDFRKRGRRHLQGARAQRRGRDGADPLAGLGPPRARALGADPLQPLSQRHDQRLGGAGLQHRRCARRDGAAVGDHAAGRLRLRVDRHRAAGEGGRRPDHGGPGTRDPVRLPVPGRALRELEHPDPGAAVGLGRRARRDRRGDRWRA